MVKFFHSKDLRAKVAQLSVAALLGVGAVVGTSVVPASLVPVASAHDVVMKATPGDGETVDTFPRRLVLEFSGVPKESFNTIALSDMDTNKVLFSTQPELKDQVVSVDVPEDIQPGPGKYRIGFQITSSDGHATRGMTTFTVAGDSSGKNGGSAHEAMTANSAESTSSDSKAQLIIPATIALAVIVIGTVVALTKRKKH